MLGRLARLASLAVIVAQPACASRLDFDSVSAKWDAAGEQDAASGAGAPAQVDARDASVDDARDAGTDDARDASALDAGRAPRDELPRDAAPREGGQSALTDAGPMDGSAYVEAGMASSASDAGADATPFSCAQQTPAPYLCDDFESYDALNAWPARKIIDPLEPEPAGGIDLDNRAARTGQGSLLAVVNPAVPTCAGCDLSVCTEWAFWELQGHQLLTIEFDMSVEQVDPHPGRRSTVFRLVFGSPEIGFSRHMLQLRSTGSGTEAAFVEGNKEAQPAGSTGIPASLERDHNWHPGPPADWVHVKYVLDAVNSGGLGNSVQVHMGKVELTNRVLYYALRYREPFLELGLPFVYTSELVADETNESWRVRFDNLLVRREQRD